MLKFLLHIIWLLLNWVELCVFTVLLYLLSFLPKFAYQAYYFYLFRVWCKIFINALGVNLKLHQKNLYRLPNRFILVSNHPSAFEDVGVPALFNVLCLAKIEVADWWIVGRINRAVGTLFVKRESKESRHNIVFEMIKSVNEGKNIALYPEGGCKGRRLSERFNYGAFHVSLKTGVPILPVFLHYECQDDFEWQPPFTLIDKIWHMMTSKNPTANFYVYDVIDPKDFGSKQEMTQNVYQKYVELNTPA